jgi:glycosyltransferase involved in cell wall biosynthesis
MTRRLRLAIVASHPVQYQAPWFRALAARADLTVFFCHQQDQTGQRDAGYSDGFAWDIPLLDGYDSVWLQNVSAQPGVFAFSGCDTPEIAQRLASGQFDACIVSGWYLKSYLQAIRACRHHGIPVLLRGDSQLTTARSMMKRAAKAVAYRLLLNAVDGHLYVGQSNRDYLRHYGVPDARLFFVPHLVNDQWFGTHASTARNQGDVARRRADLGVDEGTTVALFVGRLVESKRPFDFVQAVAAASQARNVVGVIAGSGALETALRERLTALRAPVRLAGFINQSALPALYASAQMLVLPSDASETWGLVVNEAMACGIPAVVSDAAGCARDLIEPLTGRTYRVGDVQALTVAIGELADALKQSPEAIEQALRAKTAVYSAASAADKCMAAVEQVLSHAGPNAVANSVAHSAVAD